MDNNLGSLDEPAADSGQSAADSQNLIRYSQADHANHDKKWFRAASGQTTLTVSASRQKSPRNP